MADARSSRVGVPDRALAFVCADTWIQPQVRLRGSASARGPPLSPRLTIADLLRARLGQRLLAPVMQPTWLAITGAMAVHDGAFLDLGCGAGWLCLHVAAGRPELDAVGLDTDAAALALGRQNVGTRLNVTLRHMAPDQIIYPDGTFQVAAAVMVSQRWADPLAVLTEAHRVLAPSGRLYLYEWDATAGEVPDGWLNARGPVRSLVVAALGRRGVDPARWEALKDAVRGSPFAGGEDGRHGPFRRLVLQRSPAP